MAELKYLGNILGMPNVLDPMFPLAYTAFFGMDDAGRPLGFDPLSSNVSLPIFYSYHVGYSMHTGILASLMLVVLFLCTVGDNSF